MSRNIDYEKVLNKEQLSAVTAPDGPILVIAGAGSGKTRTLIYRVAWLVEKGVDPKEILLLTFTRKAAREMLERASKLSDKKCREVSGGTFHSLAQRVLRKEAQRVGFNPSFTIMDRSDMEDSIKSLTSENDKGGGAIRFPKRSTVSNIISKAVNMEKPLDEVMEIEYPQFLPILSELEHLSSIYKEYKRKNNLMDYDDLIVFMRLLLKENKDIRGALADRYKYIMVDEYQDTNTIQADIINYIGSCHRNVMVVGDDSQAIYSFRGANFKNMFEFPAHFPDAMIIKLEENYRSTQSILTMTNALMDQAKQKYTKCLFTRRKGDEVPLAVDAGTERDQAAYVCRAIESLMDEGYKLKDTAVLFRAGYHSFELELELARRSVPFVKYGGFKFMESAHIKDVLAHLRVAVNKKDILSWSRLLRLIKNIGQGKSQAIIEWMNKERVLPSNVNEWPGSNKEKEGLNKLAKLMNSLFAPNLRPEKGVKVAVEYYSPFLQENFDDFPRRQQELEQLISMASRYKSLGMFLDDLSVEPPVSTIDVRSAGNTDHLTLSTIHSAKGLEWRAVFIIWLVEGRFPIGKSFKNTDNLEEELRLLYVAATRAKDKLFLVYPGQEVVRNSGGWGNNYYMGLSSFIRALPQDIINHHSITSSYVYNDNMASRSNIFTNPNLSSSESSELKPGDRVNHPAFGMGVIARFLGEEKVEIIFKDRGIKLLHLGYTSLEKV